MTMNKKQALEELINLMKIDAPSGDEGDVAAVLKKALTELGFTVSSDTAGEIFGGKCGNVMAYRDGELEGSILFCSHMDRVAGGIGIKPVVRDGFLYSDGTTILAADDLSGVCAILNGVRIALSSGRPLPRIEVCFTVAEELGLHGAKAIDFSLLKSKMGFAFDSPGNIGRVITAAPGMYKLYGEVTGKAAHAGNEPEKGIDAADAMCKMLATLKKGRLSPTATSNFPYITTNEPMLNAICPKAIFRGEARSRDPKELKEYVDYVVEHCQKISQECGTELEIKLEECFVPFALADDDALLTICRSAFSQMGIEGLFEVGGGGMDANVFNNCGIIMAGIATGYARNHTFSEQLNIDDFYKAGILAAELIYAYIRLQSEM